MEREGAAKVARQARIFCPVIYLFVSVPGYLVIVTSTLLPLLQRQSSYLGKEAQQLHKRKSSWGKESVGKESVGKEFVGKEFVGKEFVGKESVGKESVEGGRYVCEECKLRFASNYNLKRHARCHEKSRPRWQCPYCDKSFTRRDSLPKHMHLCHKDQVPPTNSNSSANEPTSD